MNISSVTRFIRNNLYIAFAFAVGSLLDIKFSKTVGSIATTAIVTAVGFLRSRNEKQKKKQIADYFQKKYNKSFEVIKLTREEDGMWLAECKAVDDERYFEDVKFQVKIDSWREEIMDNLEKKEKEHFESYAHQQEAAL